MRREYFGKWSEYWWESKRQYITENGDRANEDYYGEKWDKMTVLCTEKDDSNCMRRVREMNVERSNRRKQKDKGNTERNGNNRVE